MDSHRNTTPQGVIRRGLRVLVGFVAMHPRPFAAAITGAVVFALATVGTTIVLGRVVDRVLLPAFRDGTDGRAVLGGSVALLLVALVHVLGVASRRFFAGLTATEVGASLRRGVATKYRDLPLSFHQTRPTGELIAHAEADVHAATEVLHPTPYSVAIIVLVTAASVTLVTTDLVLTAVSGLVLPVVVWLNREYSRRALAPADRAQAQVGAVSRVAHESIDGALVVKTLGREAAEVERLAVHAAALRDERTEVGRLRAGFQPAFATLPVLGTVALLAVGSWRVSTGAISVGTLAQFVSLFQVIVAPVQVVGYVLAELPRAVVSKARLDTVLDARDTLPAPTGRASLPDGPLGLAVRDLAFAYPAAAGVPRDTIADAVGHLRAVEDGTAEGAKGPLVLDGVTFDVPPGGTVALVGPTGAGKSTLTQLLVRLIDPDDGAVLLGGADLRDLPAGQLRAAAALAFQESFLFADTIRENVTLGADVGDDAVRAALRLARAERFVDALPQGLDTVVGERGVTLSGGQRQRVALARALLRAPRLLILDDAASAVDPTVEAQILAGLRRELRTTLVLVAYRTATIRLADRVLFLDGGRIAATGTHEQLLAHPAYAAMVRAYERRTA